MGDEYEEATPAAKLAIANYFIMSSPPGQVDDVLVDVAKLVGDDSVLNNSELNKMMGAYNLESYATCTTEGGKIICCPAGKVSEDSFVDPSTGAVMNVDHRKREATPSGSEQSISDAKVKAFRDAIEKDLSAYLSNQYKEGKAVCGVYASDDGTITCVVSAMNKKLSSFWSGSWRSTFSLNVKEGGTVPMNGHVKIHVHYFEDGNVQLHAEREKKSNVNVTDEKSTAAPPPHHKHHQNGLRYVFLLRGPRGHQGLRVQRHPGQDHHEGSALLVPRRRAPGVPRRLHGR